MDLVHQALNQSFTINIDIQKHFFEFHQSERKGFKNLLHTFGDKFQNLNQYDLCFDGEAPKETILFIVGWTRFRVDIFIDQKEELWL